MISTGSSESTVLCHYKAEPALTKVQGTPACKAGACLHFVKLISWAGRTSFVNLSDESIKSTPMTEQDPQPGFASSKPEGSMQEFYQLSQKLLVETLAIAGIIFISVWIFYSLNIALNYLIGACTGVVYLKMLGKNVEQLGKDTPRLSKTRFAVFIGLIIVATQWQQLKILPIFLGFLTYKATLIVYMIRTLMPPDP